MANCILKLPVQKFRKTPAETTTVEEQDLIAVEEPLQIRAGERDLAVTMRTPGNDVELAAGFLFTEGLIRGREDIVDIRCVANLVEVTFAEGTEVGRPDAERNFYMTSSCGICGKASIGILENSGCAVLPPGIPRVKQSLICSMPRVFRESQRVFDRTGGLHASGLFDTDGRLILVREDVGRHNALDKLIGRALLDGQLPLHEYILLVSGRTSFELVQKAVMAGIPMLVAVGAPSSLAVQTALRFGLTLLGFVRDDRFNVYSAPGRVE